jgi:hypothetical protein
VNLRGADIAILIGTAALAVLAVLWSEREYAHMNPQFKVLRNSSSRAAWVRAIYGPSQRFQRDWAWFCVASTVGVGALLACDGQARNRVSQPGTNALFVMLLIGGVTAINQILAKQPRFSKIPGLSYSLDPENLLRNGSTGAYLGTCVVAWLWPRRRRPDGRERCARIVGWLWMVDVGLLVVSGVLFG